MKKRLVTSALPYVNNIPHLGNLIQVLSADVFARYCRQAGFETMYVCGTDEYGTATETRALIEGVTPQELCDRYHVIHRDIYKWFHIDFNHFGRTSTPQQTEIVQHLFKKVEEAGYINEKTIEQLYCDKCSKFLADRFVLGHCPHCDYNDARGDQCESCGKLLDPTDLVEPRCAVCESTPHIKTTKHLYIDLPAVLPLLETWMNEASVEGFWAKNAVQMTKSWIRDGLKERAITRDLKWGIPVPHRGFEHKVFYVWFDAPIGYISITACHTDKWKDWWQNPEEVELYQFIGKDNIPFHTVIFPSTLLGSGENWTKLHHMSSSEYLNYENTKFSKSKGVGVFGNDCQDTGIPADVWRFFIFYNRPEKSDTQFLWKDFQDKVNSELIGNLGNLVNRTLTFVNRFYEGKLPEAAMTAPDEAFWNTVKEYETKIREKLDRAELKEGLRLILDLSSFGNKEFQEGEPWKIRKEDPDKAAALLRNLIYLVKDLALLIRPYIPETSDRIGSFLGLNDYAWDNLGVLTGVGDIPKPEILFEKLEDERIEALQIRFAGSQEERMGEDKKAAEASAAEEKTPVQKFDEKIDLRVAKIIAIEKHPEAEKLYIETIDCGEEEPRTIVSGLVPYYTEEELLNKNIVLVYNLKPAKLRGVKSNGMLLAADDDKGTVDVIFVPDAQPGDRVILDGAEVPEENRKKVKADKFFDIPIRTEGFVVKVGDKALTCNGQPLKSAKVASGEVG